ncbi:glycerol-3-phosphate acyltransferase [Bacillus infantis]|uniref:glycerol-3-phosphate acyltransferase n=1 Tax=Bacillus infantis TaxID=324767 RepID=UPI002155C039|nr:glycerol-3-phosphate acyltransferase [Bacillus infantis]MCR6611454.1 glycerol-3-phosphate acyltransferase [Bacillus infantis]
MYTAAAIILCYLAGCINGAYLLARKWQGKDIRQMGSGNAGARNAGRELGKRGFFYTVLIDAGKTVLALAAADAFLGQAALLICAFAVLCGHIWPAPLGFRGGKGVVVYLASALYIAPASLLTAFMVLLAGWGITRRFTVPGLIAMAAMPVSIYILGGGVPAAGAFAIMLLIVIAAHNDYFSKKAA